MTWIQWSKMQNDSVQSILFVCFDEDQLFSEIHLSIIFVAIVKSFEANAQQNIAFVYLHDFGSFCVFSLALGTVASHCICSIQYFNFLKDIQTVLNGAGFSLILVSIPIIIVLAFGNCNCWNWNVMNVEALKHCICLSAFTAVVGCLVSTG